LRVQKNIFAYMLIETTATEESRCRVSIDHQIRLGVEKRKTVPVGRKEEFEVGLLRMTHYRAGITIENEKSSNSDL
jgi:hypothetical protein